MGLLLNRRRTMGGSLDYSKEYLTIVSRADNNVIGWKQTGADISKTVEVSTDKVTWTSYTSNTSGVTLATLSNGQKLYVRGSNTAYASSASKYNTFTSTGNFDVEGNIMSLLYGDNFAEQTALTANYTFMNLFNGCKKIINTKDLFLPATTLKARCYYGMFNGCSNLTSTPLELPALDLSQHCYSLMFYGCTSIVTGPDIIATSLSSTYSCYRMFRDCTSLTTSPVLRIKTLASGCYQQMFRGCTKLNHATMLATDISASNCLTEWLNGVAATGTLVKDASMTTLPSGVSGIPSGWTTEDYSE